MEFLRAVSLDLFSSLCSQFLWEKSAGNMELNFQSFSDDPQNYVVKIQTFVKLE